MTVIASARWAASAVRRRLWPTPEAAALEVIERHAATNPRYTPGRLKVGDLTIEYPDAQSLEPQWNDIFVRRTLRFSPSTETPRVLDCGANIGLASLWLLRQWPAARITAFEADPALAAMLRRNLDANRASSVEVVAAAAWSWEGRLSFRAEGSDSGAVAEVASDTPGRVIDVPSVRLRDRIEREPIDVLKLDVEGSELELLQDCEPVLQNVAAIHLEVHDFDPQRRLLPSCLLLLDRAGFDYTLDDLHQAPWRVGAPPAGPFTGVAVWTIAVRAWRRSRG
jgi:FkbM family methyltransferase